MNSTLAAEKISLYRTSSSSVEPSVLTDIYQENVNIAIWQNQLSKSVIENVKQVETSHKPLNVVMTAEPQNIVKHLSEHTLLLENKRALCQYVGLLVDMFCTLFELKRVGLRLTKLDRAMCPKFHVDKVPCRLVTTFTGVATQWLPHDVVDFSKLGAGSNGLPDESSGVMSSPVDIQHLNAGDVALLKGTGWFDNEHGGLVHRSPSVQSGETRLLLTLDFMD